MQRGFTKLFNTIVTSTIWQEDDKTRIVWITMLAIADHDGVVSAAVPGLASVARVDIPSTEKALKNLAAPDEYSRTQDFDGRRIEPIDGGWLVLNYEKYRKMLSEEERKEYKAKWIAKKRRQMSTLSTDVDAAGQKSTSSSASISNSVPEGVRGRFEEWMKFRRGTGKKVKHWDKMFEAQAKWLQNFDEKTQVAILEQSIRNGWQGLFELKTTANTRNAPAERSMSAFEIEKRCTAIGDEINKIFKANGNKRVEGDGIDEFKKRRDELRKKLTQ